MEKLDYGKLGRTVIETEAAALHDLAQHIDGDFSAACELLLHCQGRIVVTGMGKSGHIGNKIAATLASTGSPAFFMHPGEASHGDMGMLTTQDIVLAISNSGATDEIITLLPLIKLLNVPLISVTSNPHSVLAKAANVNLNTAVTQEACPLGLAPTTSTTCALAMGDALAITLLQARGFTSEDFALSHPGGKLGRRLLLRIDEFMHAGEHVPKVSEQTLVRDALLEMTAKKLGVTTVIDQQGKLIGLFTDGDLRRVLDHNHDIHQTPIATVMTRECKTIRAGLLAAEALQIMEEFRITSLVVTDEHEQPIGIIHMHDLLRAGVV